MQRATLRERMRYRFDSFMARGTVALIGGLAAVVAGLVFLVAVVVAISGAMRGQPVRGFPTIIWRTLLRAMDAGTIGGDAGSPLFLASMFFITIAGIFIVSALIGVLSAGLDARLESLRRGRSRVLEHDHTVILGWSQQLFPIISELIEANENRRRACVVVLADRDKVEMEEAIRERISDSKSTKIVCRAGDPIDQADIDIANVQASRSIIVLSPDIDDPDADVIKTLLAITLDPNRRKEPYHIVAEIREPRNREVALMVGRDEVEVVLVDELISRIIAQTCRQSGLSDVYADLLDFDGDEIYYFSNPSLVGLTFADAAQRFDGSTLIGIDDGRPRLNPPPSTTIGQTDQLICIAEDDDKIHLSPPTGAGPVDALAVEASTPHEASEKTLILGWNRRAPLIVGELDGYVAPGSEVLVVANATDPTYEAATFPTMSNIAVMKRSGDISDRRLLDELRVPNYDHVVVLAYSDALEAQRADAITLVTLLHLRDIAKTDPSRFSIVGEMCDLRNLALAEVARADDFVVSDRLVSLVLAQVSENKALKRVFDDLFDADGSEIYLKPSGLYVAPGSEVIFGDVARKAAGREEVAIGYRIGAKAGDASANYGIVLNPKKSDRATFADADRVIVLAEN